MEVQLAEKQREKQKTKDYRLQDPVMETLYPQCNCVASAAAPPPKHQQAHEREMVKNPAGGTRWGLAGYYK